MTVSIYPTQYTENLGKIGTYFTIFKVDVLVELKWTRQVKMDRRHFKTIDSVSHIWDTLGLPPEALRSLHLIEDGDCLPSSFKVGHLAHACIALSGLAASLYYAIRRHAAIPKVTVPLEHACIEFKSERYYVLNDNPAPSSWVTIGGLHKTSDGYVRMHDAFPNHRNNALRILGLSECASREEVASKMLQWKSTELELTAFKQGAVIVVLRNFAEWDILPQAKSIPDYPILLQKLNDQKPWIPILPISLDEEKCLRGVRVVEMSRVIAAPVAGKTLAAHGADVIWVTSPTLPDLPDLDIDLGRGKRSVQLNIKNAQDKIKLLELLSTADVFIQGYRPGSLARQGLSTEELIKLNPSLIVANLSAWGLDGPWSDHRGFDSLVQTCSGINVADAESHGQGESMRILPCQAFDHGAGYLLATGIMAALYKRAIEGGAYEVHVSLAGVMRYLRSLGQHAGGFTRGTYTKAQELQQYLETRDTSFGKLTAISHSVSIDGIKVGWDAMPKPLGSDEAVWL